MNADLDREISVCDWANAENDHHQFLLSYLDNLLQFAVHDRYLFTLFFPFDKYGLPEALAGVYTAQMILNHFPAKCLNFIVSCQAGKPATARS